MLPPNPDYWYPCIDLIRSADNTIIGNAYICYYQLDGKDMIQAITVGQGLWKCDGNVSSFLSMTQASDGINLVALFDD